MQLQTVAEGQESPGFWTLIRQLLGNERFSTLADTHRTAIWKVETCDMFGKTLIDNIAFYELSCSRFTSGTVCCLNSLTNIGVPFSKIVRF